MVNKDTYIKREFTQAKHLSIILHAAKYESSQTIRWNAAFPTISISEFSELFITPAVVDRSIYFCSFTSLFDR